MKSFFTIKKKTEDNLIKEYIRAPSFIPVLAYSPEDEVFLCDDETLSFGFMCEPLNGADEKIQERVNGFLNDEYPANTQMQFILFRSPDINTQVYQMMGLRDDFQHPLLSESIVERAAFLKHHTSVRMEARTDRGHYDNGLIHNLKLLITCKVPIGSNKPSTADMELVKQLQWKVRSSLEKVGVRPQTLDAQQWVRTVHTIFNWGNQASWRSDAAYWDKNQTLCEQVFDYDTDIEVQKDHLKFGSYYVKALSAKRMPDYMFFGDAISYAGDLSGGSSSIKENYLICTNIIFPDPEKTKHSVEAKRQFAVNQASGPLVRFVPVLLDKKNDFDLMYDSMQDGKKPIKVSYHMLVFAPSKERVESAAMAARNVWRENRFEMMVDKFVQLPVMINSLPLCSDPKTVNDLRRHKTMTSKEASVLLPIFGEWKGTGTPYLNLVSRNGQLMSFSLHDTGSNHNIFVAAQSGSGKSFLANEIISSYMSEGAQVWVIDVGRAYEKLCDAFEGDFIHFGTNSGICLNPFELIVSLDGSEATRAPGLYVDDDGMDEGEEDAIVGLLESMAAPNEKLKDIQIAGLKRHLNDVWLEKHRSLTVDDMADSLLTDEDPRIQDIGRQLYAFTSKGAYGRYFNGKNNMKFNNQLTVLELEELKGRKHLQQVVLLQLIYQIQQEIYLGERNRKKIVIIDEAWDLLTQGDVAKFIEHAYRRFRKYGGSVGIITQSINDLYTSPTGHAIAENSATTCILGQKSETVESVKKEGRLVMPEGAFEQLKTVHTVPGVYSEIFVKSEYGIGIGRLIVNDFQKLLYSTKAEDVQAIKNLTKQGHTVSSAITTILQQRNAGVTT